VATTQEMTVTDTSATGRIGGLRTGKPRSQGRIGPGSESSANSEAKLNAGKNLEEVAAEQDRVPEVKAEIRKEAGASS
jgi:hypothetical protein